MFEKSDDLPISESDRLDDTEFIMKLNVIENFSSEASETLQFIKKEDSQFPAQKGWSKKIEKLVGFLVDCERIQYKAYFCVSGENSGKVDEAKEKYVFFDII